MNAKYGIAGAVVIVGLLNTAAAYALSCPISPTGPAQLVIRLEAAPVSVRTDLDRTALSVLAGGVGLPAGSESAALGGGRGQVMGLTVANYAVEYEAEHQTLSAEHGHWCSRISRVTARLFIPETTIYVASDYAADSCAYSHILVHEHQHVAITEAALQAAGPRLETQLRKLADSPLVLATPADAEAAADDALTRSVQTFMATLGETTRRANLSIDTPANYRKVASNCRTW